MNLKKQRYNIFKLIFLFCILLCGVLCSFSVRAKEQTVGIKKTLAVGTDGSGTSYLNYISPVSGKEFRVSLHETTDGLMAYCLDRTKNSDYQEYNYNYVELKNYSKKASDLQRNILLCGYPGNTVKQLEEMYGYDTNKKAAAQATQMAIWICNYMYDEDVTMSKAWKAHDPKNTGDYKCYELSKAILSKAYKMLQQEFSVDYHMAGETKETVTYEFKISTENQFFPLKGQISGLPDGSLVNTDSTIEYEEDGSFQMNLTDGTGKITITSSRFVDISKIQLKVNGTVPIPVSYAGILYYENTDNDYQSVVVVKEVEPTYEAKSVSFSREADAQMTIEVVKEDAENGKAQGDGSFLGAQYTIYDSNNKAVEILTIGEDNKALSKKLPVDTYKVKETKSPKGYLLDSTEYQVEGKTDNTELAVIPYRIISKEEPVKGKIRIIKTLENPDSKSEEEIFAQGVVFQYYLNSNPEQKARIVTDENGFGESEWLPYGTYTLEEVECTKGWLKAMPQTFQIEKNNEILTYEIEDKIDAAQCRIVKADKNTGKNILNPAAFEIRKKDSDELVSMYTEKGEKVNRFYTNEEGIAVLPEKLQAGDYVLYEILAPEGYKKLDTPVEFHVPYMEDDVVEIILKNEPLMCRLTVEKTGMALWKSKQQIWEDYTVCVPVYKEIPLEGTEYKLTACEDIWTKDGTLRMKKGEYMIGTSDDEGKVIFDHLFPGEYLLEETKAVDGYVKMDEPEKIILKAEDSMELYQDYCLKYVNYPQQLKLDFEKQMEENMEDVYSYVFFGVFSRNDITDSKGVTLIEENSLIDVYKIESDGQGVSLMNVEYPYGTYYLKELMTHPSYELDETEYDFQFFFKEDEPVQNITLTEKPILNRLKPQEEATTQMWEATTVIEESTTEVQEDISTTATEEETTMVREEKNTESKDEKEKKSPKTSDDSQILLWEFVALIAGAGILSFSYFSKKDRKEKR